MMRGWYAFAFCIVLWGLALSCRVEAAVGPFPTGEVLERAVRFASDVDDDDDVMCPSFAPELAQTFQATIHSVLQTGVGVVAVDNTRRTDGTWLVDTVGGRMRIVGDTRTGTAPLSQPTLPLDMAWLPGVGWSLLNGQCRENPPYSWRDSWGWLGCASFIETVDCAPLGTEEVFQCSRYAIGGDSFFVSATIWEVPDDEVAVPVGFESWFLYSLGAGLVNSTTSFTLDDVQLAIPADAFVVPAYCLLEPPVCPASEDNVAVLELARIHPVNDWKFSNRNIADVLGDVGYMCEIPAESNDSLLTIFQMAMNTTWGQYGLCNRDTCMGGTPGTVGHTGTDHYGEPLAGQCSGNEAVGNWFSIAEESECTGDREVGDDGCAWKGPLAILKTITHECLIEKGFMEACAADQRYPFTSALAVVEGALLDEDEGGCPDVSDQYYSYYTAYTEDSSSTQADSSNASSIADSTSESGGDFSSDGATTDGFTTESMNVTLLTEGHTDGEQDGEDDDLTSEADFVFIALSFGCMLLACLVVSAIMAYGVVAYIKNRPQQFGWAVAGTDDDGAALESDPDVA